jgi:hypothetical protein
VEIVDESDGVPDSAASLEVGDEDGGLPLHNACA